MLNSLLKLYEEKNIYGSWLFYGKKGIGKFKTAYDLACHILIKENGESVRPLLQSHPALKILKRDITKDEKDELDKKFNKGETFEKDFDKDLKRERSIKIEQVRELIQSFSIASSKENQTRIVIIDSINDMNPNSANCLLKFLEEPPLNTIIILICHNLGNVLPTIKSRCRKILFKPLKDNEIIPILKKNYPYLSDNDINTVLFYADGSVGTALEFLENNGLDIFAGFKNVLENFPNISYSVANTVVNSAIKDETKTEILKNSILLTLHKRAKQNFDERFSEYYSETLNMFKLTGLPLNLDLRQTLISVLTKENTK